MSRPSPALKSASGSVSRAQCVVVVCPWRPRAVFGLSSPLSLYSFSNLFRLSFSVFGSIEGKLKRKFLEKFVEEFLNFARNLIFIRNLFFFFFFHEEKLIKSSESSVVCEPPNFVLLLLLLVDSHGNNNFWFEYFVGSWKFTTFLFLFRGRENFVLRLCCSRCVREWTNNLSREKNNCNFFLGFCVFVVVVCAVPERRPKIWMRRNSFSRLAG